MGDGHYFADPSYFDVYQNSLVFEGRWQNESASLRLFQHFCPEGPKTGQRESTMMAVLKRTGIYSIVIGCGSDSRFNRGQRSGLDIVDSNFGIFPGF